jgi:glycosyltransferase involved in cell wall biosynthesis
MKILLVSLHFVEYAVELARALSHENEVHLVLSDRKVESTLKADLKKALGSNVTVTLLDHYRLKNPKLLKNLFIIIKLLLTFKPDLVHHQYTRDTSNLFFFLFLKIFPFVGTIHDVHPHPGTPHASRYKYRVLKPIDRFIKKYGYKKIIVHGDSLKKDMAKTARRSLEDIFAVPHGCLFSYHSDRFITSGKEEQYSVLFFGRMQEYKGLCYLIEAEPIVSRIIPDFKVIIAGSGDDLLRYKEQLTQNAHFEIHDYYIPNDEVATFFNRSALIVLPYIEASQSGVAAIAFAFGKPVVASDVGSLSEVVQNGRTGLLVPPSNSTKLAEAIITLLEDQQRRKKMGAAASAMANSYLSWDHIAKMTQDIYKKALET